MRLIDADKLMLSLNDNYLANCPTGNETLAVQDYRESMCEGLEIAMATVEGTPTVGGWVSVKDRLPESGKRCLVYAAQGIERHISIASFGRHFHLSGRRAYWRVTHWMPLPEPPEGEKPE